MDPWMQLTAVFVSGVFASSGFWAFVASRRKTQDANVRLLLGLAYDKIASLGIHYINQGYISQDDYNDFRKYLWEPYKDFGGNGTADQIMNQISNLPFRSPSRYVSATGRRVNRENQHG